MTKLFFVLSILACAFAADSASDVTVLDPSNFDSFIGGDKPAFVEFYAPWCGHCKNLAPEYEKAATALKGQPVVVASVDADKHRDLGSRFEVSGFPTLKYFPANSKTGEAYSGGRSAKDIVDFINKKAGTNGRIKEAPTSVVVLTDSNFDSIVKDSKKNVLVEFYAPWCGHCKSLAPTYEKLGGIFASEPTVVIAKVDATENPDSASAYGVNGYPTIKYFPAGDKSGQDYNGGRAIEDFVKFINEKAGTERTSTGGFLETAGRIPELDELAAKFVKNSDERATILKSVDDTIAAVASNKNADLAKFYKITMGRIIAKGIGYVDEEEARLKRMLESGAVAPDKVGEFAKRANIVRQFKS